jgi:hypothetical protein
MPLTVFVHCNDSDVNNHPSRKFLIGHRYFGCITKQKGRRKPAPFGNSLEEGRLLSGNLARRIERAGVVNFRNLMVGEAQNLPKNLVGVLTEQWRARHL